LYWTRKTDEASGTVVYKALGGYEYRRGLHNLGFEFDGREKAWAIAVPRSDAEALEKIETFLKATDKIDKAAARVRYASGQGRRWT
jgi:hypothetical protein